jgi:hypothetical protein
VHERLPDAEAGFAGYLIPSDTQINVQPALITTFTRSFGTKSDVVDILQFRTIWEAHNTRVGDRWEKPKEIIV